MRKSIRNSVAGNQQKPKYIYSELKLPEIFSDEDITMPGAYKSEKYEIKIGKDIKNFDPKDGMFGLVKPIGPQEN